MKTMVIYLLATVCTSLYAEENLKTWLNQLATQNKKQQTKVYTRLLSNLNEQNPAWVTQLNSNTNVYGITASLAKHKDQDLAIAILFYHLLQEWPNSNYAGKALATMGPRAKEVIPFLEEQLSSPDFAIRNNTLVRLGLLGGLAKEVALKMARLVNDPHPKVREQALEELAHVQPSTDVIPTLRNVLRDDKFSQKEKRLALSVIEHIELAAITVSEEIILLLNNAPYDTKIRILLVIQTLETSATVFVDHLIPLLQHPSNTIRSLVSAILETTIPEQAKEIIAQEEHKRKVQEQKEQQIVEQQQKEMQFLNKMQLENRLRKRSLFSTIKLNDIKKENIAKMLNYVVPDYTKERLVDYIYRCYGSTEGGTRFFIGQLLSEEKAVEFKEAGNKVAQYKISVVRKVPGQNIQVVYEELKVAKTTVTIIDCHANIYTKIKTIISQYKNYYLEIVTTKELSNENIVKIVNFVWEQIEKPFETPFLSENTQSGGGLLFGIDNDFSIVSSSKRIFTVQNDQIFYVAKIRGFAKDEQELSFEEFTEKIKTMDKKTPIEISIDTKTVTQLFFIRIERLLNKNQILYRMMKH